jgi:hypothetical protein
MRGEEGGDRGVNKLGAIVGLHSNKRARELSVNISDKSNERGLPILVRPTTYKDHQKRANICSFIQKTNDISR